MYSPKYVDYLDKMRIESAFYSPKSKPKIEWEWEKSEYDGRKALKTLTFWKSHSSFDSKMIADTKAILFVLILASERFAGLLSHPILYRERKRLCWLSVKEGRQSLLLFFAIFFEVGKEQVTQFLQPHHDLLRRVWSKKPWTHWGFKAFWQAAPF